MKTPLLAHPALSAGFLSRLNDGELNDAERNEFESHRAACVECDAAAREFEAVLALYRSARADGADPELASRLARRLDARLAEPPRLNFLPVRLDVAWAAILVVALAAGLLLRGVLLERARRERESRVLIADQIKPLRPAATEPRAPTSPSAARAAKAAPAAASSHVVVEEVPESAAPGSIPPSRIVAPAPDDSSWTAWSRVNRADVAAVEIEVAADGSVAAARIVSPEEHQRDDLVLDAVRRWRFNPAKRGGALVAGRVTVRFRGGAAPPY